jgi:putative acetyltransferase
VGRAVLAAILDEARRRSYARVSLETGSHPHFTPAHTLYAKAGFEPCRAFAGYADDPNSAFMTIRL